MKRQAIYTRENAEFLIEQGREWNFHGVDTQEHLHALHPYPAKFIPQIPRKAIEAWSKVGDVVYDPFVGAGTTLLEASLLGRPSVGTDNNSVAVLVSRAKTANYTSSTIKTLEQFLNNFDSLISKKKTNRKLIPTNPNFLYWFSEDVLLRLATLKGLILDVSEPAQTLLMAIFSSIIVRVSFQDSDTRYARISKVVHPAEVDKAFKAKLSNVLDQLPKIQISGRAKASIREADARSIPFIKSETVNLIVTSPPYLNAYDYHKYHRQRIHWIDGSVEFSRDIEIGSHDEFTRKNATPDQYFEDMNACFYEWSRVLKNGGRCFVVIGDAIVSKNPVQVADQFVDLLKVHGLFLEKRWIRELQGTKRAFNVRNSRMSHEHLLLFRK